MFFTSPFKADSGQQQKTPWFVKLFMTHPPIEDRVKALRQMAQSYPYDAHSDREPSLRSHGEEINSHLREQIQTRLGKAGVQVTEARISHLAYAQEIAQAMLQRQQAGAIVAARERIVEGAVGMVGMALEELRKQGVVELDEERKAAMVSNLLVVLCGERGTQPVLNTGTLYN